MPLSVAAACNSKLKVRQKRLRSASPQARLMRAPKGACSTNCMPPPSSKKRSATTRSAVGSAPSAPRAGAHIGDGLLRAACGRARTRAAATQSGCGRATMSSRSRETSRESSSVRPGASPCQNGIDGRRAVRIFHAHAARLHAPDAPGRGAQQKHIAGQALDGEIFVERADRGAFRLGDHLVLRGLRNRAARCDGREPRAAPRRARDDSPGRDAGTRRCARARWRCLRKASRRTASKSRAVQRRDTASARAPDRTARLRRNLRRRTRRRSAAPEYRAALRGISSRSSSPARMARTSAAHSISSSRVVAKRRPFGQRAHPVAGAADALQRHRDRARRADLADQVHRADIDAQFERSRRHHRAQFAVLQPRFGFQAQARARGCRDAAARRSRPAARPE